MINKAIFLILLIFPALIFEAKSKPKSILYLNTMDKISFDSSDIHKIWELNAIKPLSKGMGGMDDGFKILDFRDKKKLFLIGQNNIPVSTLYYRIDGNIVFIFNNDKIDNESDIESDVVWKISNLTHDKLVITLAAIEKDNNQITYRDFVELTYKVKN